MVRDDAVERPPPMLTAPPLCTMLHKGRAEATLDVAFADKTVKNVKCSPLHATLSFCENAWYLSDCGSGRGRGVSRCASIRCG